MSTMSSIRAFVAKQPKGEPFTPAGLAGFGSRAAVDQTLTRLVKAGVIQRIARGIYVKPQISSVVGPLSVPPGKVAEAIARASHTRIQVSGAEAANRLGLTTQVPAKPVFLTEGASRNFRMGRLHVVIRRVSSRRMAGVGTEAGPVISALYHVGQRGLSESVVAHLASKLPKSTKHELEAHVSQVPAWMAEAIQRITGQREAA